MLYYSSRCSSRLVVRISCVGTPVREEEEEAAIILLFVWKMYAPKIQTMCKVIDKYPSPLRR